MTSELKSLPKDTVRLIGSSQVITSVYSVVKELLENSFDADATSVDIKLENYGFDKIEVRDNGTGIRKANIPLVALRYHTSKISSFADLDSLATFGFRGEALGSLCAVSQLSITSKCVGEDVSHTYSFDHHGNVTHDQPSHLAQGTTVLATNLFSNMPVRRQYYNTLKKRKDELKRVEDLCLAYAAIRPHMRLSVRHNKDIVWQKIPSADTRVALLGILGRNAFSQLQYKAVCVEEIQLKLEVYLPKADSSVSVTSKSVNDRGFVAVNGRPVQVKEIDKIVRRHYCSRLRCEGRHPVYFISVSLPASDVDVNLDPNKNRVLLQQQKLVLEAITEVCAEIYGPLAQTDKTVVDKDSSSDTLNETVSPDSSFVANEPSNMEKNMIGRVTSKVTEADTDNVKVSKLTNKFGHGASGDVEQTCRDQPKGYNISFYDGQGSGDSDSRNTLSESSTSTASTCNKENVGEDDIDSVKKPASISGDTQNKSNCERVDFDILDADLSDLLKTQVAKTGEDTLHPSFSNSTLDDCFTDTVDYTKIVTNTNNSSNKENVITCANSDNDHRMIFDENLKVKTCDDETNIKDTNMTKAGATDQQLCAKLCPTPIDVQNSVDTDWSRGDVRTAAGNQVLQPVQLLVSRPPVAGSNKRPPSPSHDLELLATTPPAKKRPPSTQVDQPRIYDLVSPSSDSSKYSSGFVAFSKQIRPIVVEEHPDASYDNITSIVRSRWDKLGEGEREEFCETGARHVQELRKTVTSSKRQLGQKLDRRVAAVKGLPSIKDQLLAGALQKGGTKPTMPIKSVKVPFSLAKLKEVYSLNPSQSPTQPDPGLRLIGPLKYYNGWACCRGNQVALVNPARVEETLLHREMMEGHVIDAARLDTPQHITESSVGGPRLYQALLDMVPSDRHQTYTHIDDRRLTANGIQVRCHEDQDGRRVLDLVGVTRAMPLYGIKDLQEILDLVLNTGATTLGKARPLKVVFYLQGEAVRMIRQRPVHRTREDMLDLLQQMELLPVDCVTCLHNKTLLHTVYDMDDIPVTQSITGSS